jgi:membrane-associated sensor protein
MADGLMQQPVGGYIAELRGSSAPSPDGSEPAYQHAFLSTVIADRGDRRLAVMVVLVSLLGFAAAIPFAKVPLLQVDAFIPAYESALILIDAITAVMLFGQFRWSRSPALLVLAAGFLYDALLIIPHVVSFPDVFALSGLIGGGQTTAWLYNFWHGGFPLFDIAYAFLAHRQGRRERPAPSESIDAGTVGLTIITTAALAAGLTALAINHASVLPVLMDGNGYRPAQTYTILTTWTLGLVGLAVL